MANLAPLRLPPSAAAQLSESQNLSSGQANPAQAYVNSTNNSISNSPTFRPQSPQPVVQDDRGKIDVAVTGVKTQEGVLDGIGLVAPQPNILDNFASSAWAASVYLLSPTQYTALMKSNKRSVNGYNLLFQSGGAPINIGGYQGASNPTYTSTTNEDGVNQGTAAGIPGSTAPDAGRNPAFSQDFYIDSVEIENLMPGKGTQAAHSVSQLKFTVIEPGSITLLDRMYAAVQDMAQTLGASSTVNYTAAQYLMVIRWYGYDINGNIVAGKTPPDERGLSDTNAIVEKFIPFVITNIDWGVTNKLVTYDFDCTPVGQQVAGSTTRGTIPYDVQLTAQSVKQLLGDVITVNSPTEVNQSSNAASTNVPNASAAPSKKINLKSGLAQAMTQYAQQLVDSQKVYLKADRYSIVFDESAKEIAEATIVLPGEKINDRGVPMGIAAQFNPNQSLNQAVNPMNITAQNWSITAGMQMAQAIDLAIRNSSYVWKQGLYIIDKNGKQTVNPNAGVDSNGQRRPIKWYKIDFYGYPLQYDTSRNDFAYEVQYVISGYELPNIDSAYFPLGVFKGVHKSYPYWFTGQNSAVLDYTANFNAAYHMTVSGGPNQASADTQLRRRLTSNGRDIYKYGFASRSSESSQGGPVKGTEQQSNAAEYLYAIDQPGGTQLKIIGDPAWIQQGRLSGSVTQQGLSAGSFLPDGTINFDNSQIFFEIAWQRPEDYNLATGLADPYARPGNTPGQPQQTNIYQVTKVVSEFRGGKFEQILTGLLYYIPVPDAQTGGAGNEPTKISDTGSQTQSDASNRQESSASNNRINADVFRGGVPGITEGTAAVRLPTQLAQSVSRAGTIVTDLNTAIQGAAKSSGTLTLSPTVLNSNYSVSMLNQSSSPPIQPADVVAPVRPPQPPTGSGVTQVGILRGPQPLNAAALRPPQVIVRDS